MSRSPDWTPLQRALVTAGRAHDVASEFRFVGFVDGPDDVGELRLYEHAHTRQHITLDVDGRAYRHYDDVDIYGSVTLADALKTALGAPSRSKKGDGQDGGATQKAGE